jgi:hypothetical protein
LFSLCKVRSTLLDNVNNRFGFILFYIQRSKTFQLDVLFVSGGDNFSSCFGYFENVWEESLKGLETKNRAIADSVF